MKSAHGILCKRIDHASGIVEFVISENSIKATHAYLDMIEARLREVQNRQDEVPMIRHLTVFEGSGMPQMVQIFRGFRKTFNHLGGLPPGRVAYLFRSSQLTTIAVSFATILARLRSSPILVRFMTVNQRKAAIAWLLSDDPA